MIYSLYYGTRRISRKINEYAYAGRKILMFKDDEPIDYIGTHYTPIMKTKINFKGTYTAQL